MQIGDQLLPLNQFLKGADGQLSTEPGARFLDGIHAHVISEARLEAWAVCRYMQLPPNLFDCCSDTSAKPRAWKDECANDMELLRTQPATYWKGNTPWWRKRFTIIGPGYYNPALAAVAVSILGVRPAKSKSVHVPEQSHYQESTSAIAAGYESASQLLSH